MQIIRNWIILENSERAVQDAIEPHHSYYRGRHTLLIVLIINNNLFGVW